MITSYHEILKHHARSHPRRVALISEGQQITYAELYHYAIQVAQWLSVNDFKQGDHIILLELNTAEQVHFANGCLLCGVIPVAINWRLTPPEILFIINDTEAKLFLYGDTFSSAIAEINKSDAITCIALTSLFKNIETENNIGYFTLPEITMQHQALLIYTSGTTGNPKGVMLSHENIFEMYIALRNETPLFGAAAVNLIAGPWYAVVGIGYFIFGVYTGCTNVLLKMFNPIAVLELIATYKVTNTFLAPVMMKIICELDEVHDYDLSSLQHIQYGGSPISEAQLIACVNTFNCCFTQGYGLTETSGIATALRFDDHSDILASSFETDKKLLQSAGRPYAGVEIKIVDEEGHILPHNEIGEIAIRGKVVAMGYRNYTAGNDKYFSSDGWFYTGDMGYLNSMDFLFLVDRKNDMIISRGQNIYPAEIELVCLQHPQIKEVAVIGIPHDTFGESIAVFAVLQAGALSLNELRVWAADKVPEIKLPTLLIIQEELPRNPTGKVLRKLLREQFWLNQTRRIN